MLSLSNEEADAILFCAFASFLSISLFQLFALNFNFLHYCLGLIDVLSANEHAEMFAGILLCL